MLRIHASGPTLDNLTPSGPMSKGFAGYALSRMSPGNYCFLEVPTHRMAQLLAMRFHSASIRLGQSVRTLRGPSFEDPALYGLHVWRDA